MRVTERPAVPTTAPPSTSSLGLPPAWPWFAFAIAAIVSVVMLLHLGRGLFFSLDEWNWVLYRRDPSADALLDPHSGHLSLVPVAIYELYLWIFGITEYTAFRVLVVVLHVVAIGCAFAYLRARVGVPVALAASVVLLLFGAGWHDLLWAFQIGFILSIAGGIGAFLLLDSGRPNAHLGAMGCLVLSLASSSIGVPIAIGLVIELALRRAWRRWWVVGVPLIAYGTWYAAYGESFGETRSKWLYTDDLPPVLDVVRFAIECAGSTVGALVGAGSTTGQVLLLPVLAVIVFGFVRADSTRRPRLVALVAIPVVFWIGLGFSRLGIATPDSSRYLYPAAVFVVLLLGECLRGVRVPAVALVAVVAVLCWSLAWNFGEFAHGRDFLLEGSRQTRVELGAINLGTRGVDARYAAARTPVRRHLRPWLSAFDDLGFPGATPGQITNESERFRRQADAVLVYTAGVDLARARSAAGRAPMVTTGHPGTTDGESCLSLRSSSTPVDVELVARTPALRIEAQGAPVAIRVRHFARGYFADAAAWRTLHTGKARSLWLPDVAGGDWTVGITTPARVRVCGVAEPR